MNTKLISPSPEIKDKYEEYINEWQQADEKIVPYFVDPLQRTFEIWLEDTYKGEHKETCPENFVPASTYFLVDDAGKILGATNIRHQLNESLLVTGGHIGYGVRPSERRKGYATQILKLSIEQAKKLGLSKVLVTCDKDNLASAKTIINNGGILENEVDHKGKMAQRYWIKI